MKYIDADRLKAEIKRQIRLEELNFAALGGGGQTFCINIREGVLKIIDSLQQEQPNVDLEKLALEKYPIHMVAKDPFDDEDDTKEDLNEYEREAYLEGLKKGYELGRKGGK